MNYFFILFLGASLLPLTTLSYQQEKAGEGILRTGTEGSGLRADYYNGTNFEKKVFSRIEEEINFYYLDKSPAPGVNADNYSIRWTGSLYAPVTGTYKVFVRVDDGVRLWVNGVKVLDEWKLQEVTTYAGQLNLKGGEFYSLKIEYYNGPFHGVMRLLWESPEDKTSSFLGLFESTPPKVIPKKYLYEKLPENKVTPVFTEEIKKEEKPTASDKVAKKSTRNKIPEATKRNSENKSQPKNPKPEAINPFDGLKAGEVVQFKNVWFEQGKYVLLKDSYAELDKLADALAKYPALKIRIEGHTDNVGNPALNQSLSLFRAKVVATYLLDKGIDPSRIAAKGYGHSRPLADNSTEEGRAKNRRVEFVVE